MNMNRNRPPKDCPDLELWLSMTVNDAIRDAVEAGLPRKDAAYIVLSHGRHTAAVACLTEREILDLIEAGR